jgi:hypothetical protein
MGLKKEYDELEITDGPLRMNGGDVKNVDRVTQKELLFNNVGIITSSDGGVSVPYDGSNDIHTVNSAISIGYVQGVQRGASGRTFFDIIIVNEDSGIVRHVNNEANNPATRTYTNSNRTINLSISGGSGSDRYVVRSIFIELGQNDYFQE